MASPDWKLSVLTFPQHWDGVTRTLQLRWVVLPRVSPLDPLVAGEPAFVDAGLSFVSRIIPSLERLPMPADVQEAAALGASTPADLRPLYAQLAGAFQMLPAGGTAPKPEPRRKDTRIKKFLPASYRAAFAFDQPRTPFAHIDDTYRCALQTPPKAPPVAEPFAGLSWGQVIATLMQQPPLAERAGLVYHGSVTLPSDTFLENGGWVYAGLAAGSAYAALAGSGGEHVKYYAARLPQLQQGDRRPLFAAVLFPVKTTPSAESYDDNFSEADAYDDGFAKIVHCEQPDSADPTAPEAERLPAVQDAGIELGWDDEQVTIWMNRQIDPLLEAQDSPMAVFGYVVDARQAGTIDWTSLNRVKGTLRLGSVLNDSYEGERALRVAPMQLHGLRTGDYWLPSYFARWSGKSLVAKDAFVGRLTGGVPATAGGGSEPVGLGAVPLRYGRSYEFRVRLMDVSGGTPDIAEVPRNPAAAPTRRCDFRRFVAPKAVRVLNLAPTPDPTNPQKMFTIRRPVLGYPSIVFADVPDAENMLVADIPSAAEEGREVGLPDPDVTAIEVVVEVSDPASEASGFRTLYTTTRPFPPSDDLTLNLVFEDIDDVANLLVPEADGPLPVPTARDIRLRLAALCRPDPTLTYFGSQDVRRGPDTFLPLRAASGDERELFVSQSPANRLRGILLQPDPPASPHLAAVQAVAGRQEEAPASLAQRLAQALRIHANGLTFFGRADQRLVFGCAAGIRHVLGPDHSTIVFASKADLTHQWLPVLTLRIDRDWTWDGLADAGIVISREITHLLTGDKSTRVVGTIQVPRSVNPSAMQAGDRTTTDVVFFDAIDPKPRPGDFPSELEVTYTVTPSFKHPPEDSDESLTITLRLPIATPPTQTPRVASAGVALSVYSRTQDYSSSDSRQRMLWLEFEEPLKDKRDAYFARVLAYSADPVLSGWSPAPPPEPLEPPLPLDPELIRTISPAHSDDSAGLHAMQRLIPSDSPRHFLVPLPPGLTEESPELFGFFVYELRVGHADGWSTAQGRFGAPLRVTGIHHPEPALHCQVARRRAGVSASAPFATPVFEGRAVTPSPPQSELWGLLYAQVVQIDEEDRRNVLLSRRAARPLRHSDRDQPLDVMAVVDWDQSEINALLRGFALPVGSPLSVIVVELMPQLERRPDPLGGDLGHVRILRASPLTRVPAVCL